MSGRRRPPEEETARKLQLAAESAVDMLLHCVENEEEKTEVRIRAAGVILDRALGKSKAPAEGGELVVRFDRCKECGE